MRVSPNDIVTDDLDHVLAMSSVRSPYRRSEIYSNVKFDFDMDHVFSERDEGRHQELRRKLAAGVSYGNATKAYQANLCLLVLGKRKPTSRNCCR